MEKASAEKIARVLALTKQNFPAPDLLPLLEAEGAINDAPEMWIDNTIKVLEDLPTRRKQMLHLYTLTSSTLAKKGEPRYESSPHRVELTNNLKEGLLAYFVEPAEAEAFIQNPNLAYFDDESLQDIAETIEPLQKMTRHFLQTLLDLDDKVEASAKRKEERDAEREARAKEREARAQESAARAQERQEQMRAKMAALRGEG